MGGMAGAATRAVRRSWPSGAAEARRAGALLPRALGDDAWTSRSGPRGGWSSSARRSRTGCIFCNFPAQPQANDRAEPDRPSLGALVHDPQPLPVQRRPPDGDPARPRRRLRAAGAGRAGRPARRATPGRRGAEAVAAPEGLNVGMNLGKSAGAGIVRSHALPRGPALGGRQQLHAGARRRPRHRRAPRRDLGDRSGRGSRRCNHEPTYWPGALADALSRGRCAALRRQCSSYVHWSFAPMMFAWAFGANRWAASSKCPKCGGSTPRRAHRILRCGTSSTGSRRAGIAVMTSERAPEGRPPEAGRRRPGSRNARPRARAPTGRSSTPVGADPFAARAIVRGTLLGRVAGRTVAPDSASTDDGAARATRRPATSPSASGPSPERRDRPSGAMGRDRSARSGARGSRRPRGPKRPIGSAARPTRRRRRRAAPTARRRRRGAPHATGSPTPPSLVRAAGVAARASGPGSNGARRAP